MRFVPMANKCKFSLILSLSVLETPDWGSFGALLFLLKCDNLCWTKDSDRNRGTNPRRRRSRKWKWQWKGGPAPAECVYNWLCKSICCCRCRSRCLLLPPRKCLINCKTHPVKSLSVVRFALDSASCLGDLYLNKYPVKNIKYILEIFWNICNKINLSFGAFAFFYKIFFD